MARRGVQVEIFTRATSSADPPVVARRPGRAGAQYVAGPFEGLDKYDLPTQLCAVHRRGAAGRGQPRARLLRHRAFALLAVRAGRLAGPRPLGGAAGAHRPHPGRGQERRAGRRRRPRAAAACRRRAAGGRRGRPADREHRRRSPPTGFAAPRATRPGSTWCIRASTCRRSRPATGGWRAPRLASAATSRWWRSSAASSRSRRPMCCCARRPGCPACGWWSPVARRAAVWPHRTA